MQQGSHGRRANSHVDRVPVDHANVQMGCSEDDQEIDVVNMSIQCHGVQVPDRVGVLQEHHQPGNIGSKGPGKGGKSSDKGIGGFSGRGTKGRAVSLSSLLNGPRLEPSTMVSRSRMRPLTSPSLCFRDIGNVDVDGGWQVQKGSEESVSNVVSAWLVGDDVQRLHRPREPS